MHKNRWLALSALLIVAILLGACAKTEEATAEGPTAEEAVIEEEATAEKIKVAFIYIYWTTRGSGLDL